MGTRYRRLSVVASVVGMLLLAGCQPRDVNRTNETVQMSETGRLLEPSSESPTINPCELLMPTEIEEALGQPFDADQAGRSTCIYSSTDPLRMTSLFLEVQHDDDAGDYLRYLERTGSESGHRYRRIDGPGDMAILSTTSDRRTYKRGDDVPTVIAQLYVLERDTLLRLKLAPANRSDWSAGTLTQLADLAVRRLP